MEVPGIAPGSAEPSPSVSTCVFEDQISPTVGLLNGPLSASHSRLSPSRQRSLRPATETSPNYRRSPDRLGRAAWGTGHVSYAAKAKLSLAVVFFPGVSRGSGKPRHATSGSENASNLFHPLVINQQRLSAPGGRKKRPPRLFDTKPAAGFRQSPSADGKKGRIAFAAFRGTQYTPRSRTFNGRPGRKRSCVPTRRR